MNKLNQALEKAILTTKHSAQKMPWSDKNFYANYLAQTFYYVRHSTRILALSAARLDYENQQKIHLRFLKHLGEEANHEKLALNDLKYLGHDINDFEELNSTRLFYETQYYKIEHQHPMALMGYILYLEVLAQNLCPSLAKKLTESFGKKATTFLFVHGEEDPHHVDEAKKLLASLDPVALNFITINLEQSACVFNNLLDEIKNQKSSSIKKVA